MKTTLIILFLLSNTFLFTTCKQQGANPCKEPTADFTMEENPQISCFGYTIYASDTQGPGFIQFTALEPNAKYQWKIGTDTTVFTKQQFMLDFGPYYAPYYPNMSPPITITLKVTKSPGSCFPASDSVKYMTRTLYLTDQSLVNGMFKGHFNKDTIENTLSINTDTIINNSQNGIFIKGLPNHDSILMNDGEGEIALYRKIVFNFTSTGANLNFNDLGKGEIMVTPDGKTIYGWITQTDPKLPSYYTFTGTRI